MSNNIYDINGITKIQIWQKILHNMALLMIFYVGTSTWTKNN